MFVYFNISPYLLYIMGTPKQAASGEQIYARGRGVSELKHLEEGSDLGRWVSCIHTLNWLVHHGSA